jgi:hypothetical protein
LAGPTRASCRLMMTIWRQLGGAGIAAPEPTQAAEGNRVRIPLVRLRFLGGRGLHDAEGSLVHVLGSCPFLLDRSCMGGACYQSDRHVNREGVTVGEVAPWPALP